MATVVSHAMRRIATTPDANYSSCGIRSEKSRLSWTPESSESALSRSMRYAEPWLYDGVRGSSGLLLAPALVLCSCQDYLNGTKRSSKNKKVPSPCKKCKGTRIPLSNGDAKFGTMRCYPTTALAQTPIRAGTVRVTSGSRPSILPTTDPYDLMRRSRLTVGDNGSQFRARSVSPNKGRSNEPRSSSGTRHKAPTTKYSTVGRRSILECNVNPYELMSAENDAKDASITLLNGQRIRVRRPIADYEDVDRPTKTKTKPRASSTSSSSPACYSPKSNEKESESSRFKSILKKPSTTFSDTDSSYETNSNPSPLQQRSGSHFYLPMPMNGPRKKVQFLVENELVSLEHNGDYQTPSVDEGEVQGRETGNNDDVTSRADDSESKKSCKLKRSESDRALKEGNNKVIFHDSMALRSQNYRTDSRIIFTEKDLERLDGIYISRFGKTRPVDPPPEPPTAKSEYQKHQHHEENYEDIKETTGNPKLRYEDNKCKSKNDSKRPKVNFEVIKEAARKPKSANEGSRKSNNLSRDESKSNYEGSPKKVKEVSKQKSKESKVKYEDRKSRVVHYEDIKDDTSPLSKNTHYEDLDDVNHYSKENEVNYEGILKKEKQNSDIKEKGRNFKEQKHVYSQDKKEKRRDSKDHKQVDYEDIIEERRNSNDYKETYYEDIDKEKHNPMHYQDKTKERRSSTENKEFHYQDVNEERCNSKERKQLHYEDIIDDGSKFKEHYNDICNDKTKVIIDKSKTFSYDTNEEMPPSAPPRKRSNSKQPNNNKFKKQINGTKSNQIILGHDFETKVSKEENRKLSIEYMEDEVFEDIENNYEDLNLKQTTENPIEVILPLNDGAENGIVLIKTHFEDDEIQEIKPIRKVSFPEEIYESIKIRTDTDTISINSNHQGLNRSLLINNEQDLHTTVLDNDYNLHKTILANDYQNPTIDAQTSVLQNDANYQDLNKTDLKNDIVNLHTSVFNDVNKTVLSNDYQDPNKTILKINTKPTVHKLKIKNEYPETNNINTISISDNTLGKTSIMINGDDCYSTIKVCDEIPLYHSSVVVKDTGSPTENKKSSSVYITGNFVNTYVNGTAKTFNDTEKVVEKDAKEIEEVVLREKPSMSNLDLLKCLSDPVEAVRMNLVPHVCGKSDPPRRPKRGDSHLPQIQTLSEEDKVAKFIEESFLKLRNNNILDIDDKDISSEHSSSTQYEIMDQGSECYTDHSNRSSITEEELNARTKFYELLADSSVVEVSENEDHHYESIKMNPDPIYEEIEIPPPLPSNPPPSSLLDDLQLDKEYTTRSIFEGASKYDILSYLVDAKERGIVPEDSYTYNFNNTDVVIEEEAKDNNELPYNRVSHLSTVSDSSEDSSLVMSCSLTDNDNSKIQRTIEVERNDSGVGSETSKSSLSKYRVKNDVISSSCEDCESLLENLVENEPLICRKCLKKRTERKEIITEIVETEEKYSRDLQIILEEFYQPMLVAGLLTSDQLSAIFLNVEELLENSQALAERLRDAVEIAIEQGDEDLQTVNIGKLVLEAAPMLHAFETYCVRQGPASLLLASLEKEKELLRIFLRVSQMENTVLRRMNLNSFLMVPVQRVTKYPLLLARLYKVTPMHHDTREQLKEAQHKIELHLNHMNSETKDVPSKLWRRISSIPGRRSSSEMDLVNIKLRKIAVDVLEWNHDEAKFALEGRLLFTQPTDNNWRKGRTIKLTPVNALLVTNGKSTSSTRTDPADESLVFSRQAGVRDAALLLVRDKNGRYSLLREPLYLDRCVIAADPAWQSYFEVQELLGKDTFIFKAEDEDQTKIWYRQLQYYAQGMGAWRKRRNALANIMINGMGLRS